MRPLARRSKARSARGGAGHRVGWRRPLSDSLGLDGTGVEVDERGFVKIDESCRTTVSGVWAVGDLVATAALAHVGFAEAIVVIKDILGERPLPVQYDKVPWAIYCRPEVAFAGHSEESAKEAGFDVAVSKHQFRGNSRALIVGETDGLVKVIAEKGPDGRAAASWVCTWSVRGHRAARAGYLAGELGPPSTRWPRSSSPIRHSPSSSARPFFRSPGGASMADVTMPQLG